MVRLDAAFVSLERNASVRDCWRILVLSVHSMPEVKASLSCTIADTEQEVWHLYKLQLGDEMGNSIGWSSLHTVNIVCVCVRSMLSSVQTNRC